MEGSVRHVIFITLALGLFGFSLGGCKLDDNRLKGHVRGIPPPDELPPPENPMLPCLDSITIAEPETSTRLGWSTRVSGTCSNAQGPVMISVGEDLAATIDCDSNSFAGVLDIATVAPGTGTRILKFEQSESCPAYVSVNKENSDCDSMANREKNLAEGLAGGDGTSVSPYIICTADQLNQMRYGTASTFRYALKNDINFDHGDTNGDGVIDSNDSDYSNWNRIGPSTSDPFAARLYGNNFTIHNLTINTTTNDVGFLGFIRWGGRVNDLIFKNPNIKGGLGVGVLAAQNHYNGGGGGVSNIHVIGGVVEGAGRVGSIIGVAQTYITTCSSSATVIGTGESVGGITGIVGQSTLSHCIFTGRVEAPDRNNVGGITGDLAHFVTIRDSSFSGVVIGLDNVGGIAGVTYMGTAQIQRSHSSGTIIGRNQVGGILGRNGWSTSTPHRVSTSHATSSAEVLGAGNNVGGIVGDNQAIVNDSYSFAWVETEGQALGGAVGRNTGTITNSYAAGPINTEGTASGQIGGLVGSDNSGEGVTNDSFWDLTVTGLGSDGSTADSEGGVGKSTANMQQQSTFDPPWDFTTIWKINSGDYPRLQWEP